MPTQNKDVILKMKKSNIKKYGIENTFNLIQTKNTFLEKYNVINPSQIPAVQEKIKETCLKKYGSNAFFASDYAREKIKNTCMERYGVPHVMQNKETYIKILSKTKRAYRLKEYITKFGDNIYYQSIPELEFIKFCESKNIQILDGDIISYELNGKNRKYFVDFKIIESTGIRLVEIKRKHPWWFSGLKSGEIKAKTKCAIKFSKENGYLPYKIIFENKI